MLELENGVIDIYRKSTDHFRYISLISDSSLIKNATIRQLVQTSASEVKSVDSDMTAIPNEEMGPRHFLTTTPCYIFNRESSQAGYTIQYLVNLLNLNEEINQIDDLLPSFRLSDGVVIIVDIEKGVTMNIEAMVRKALVERLKPVLFVDRLDAVIFDEESNLEEIYKDILGIIDKLNNIINTYENKVFNDLKLDPIKGNVIFGCSTVGWGFSLNLMAKVYSLRFKMKEFALVPNLWGDKFYDPASKKFISSPISDSGETLPRSFCKLCLDPIRVVNRTISSGNNTSISKMCSSIKVQFPLNFLQYTTESLHKLILQSWLNLSHALLDSVILHIPSPYVAQRYRIDYLYEGNNNGCCSDGMKSCDKEGQLMIYFTKMLQTESKEEVVLGRIFSGTLFKHYSVEVLGSEYVNGESHDRYRCDIIDYFVVQGNRLYQYNSECGVPAGNIIALSGCMLSCLQSGTITDFDAGYGFKTIKHFEDAQCVRCIIRPENSDMHKMLQYELDKIKSVSVMTVDLRSLMLESNYLSHIESIIHHLESTIPDLVLIKSHPEVIYKETVVSKNYQTCQAISKNGYNRIVIDTESLNSKLVDSIDHSNISTKYKTQLLINKHNWSATEAKKIWSFGPRANGPNILTCQVPVSPELNAVKESVIASFQAFCEKGCLCEEEIRGVKFDIIQLDICSENSKRSRAQIVPMVTQALKAAFLTSVPALVEPVYSFEIHCNPDKISAVCESLSSRRAVIKDLEQFSDSSSNFIQGIIPVSSSFNLSSELLAITQGECHTTFNFHSWSTVSGSPYDSSSQSSALITSIRSNKKLPPSLPTAEDFLYDPYQD
jgi:elongation factor 2